MTIDEAIRILDPKTMGEALSGLEKSEALQLVKEACRVACIAMRACKNAISKVQETNKEVAP